MKTVAKHPMSDLVLSAFENDPALDATKIAVFLAGATSIRIPRIRTNGMKHYKVVAQDVLGCLHEQGLLTQDDMGWYYRPA